MEAEANLRIDIHRLRKDPSKRVVARVCVGFARGYASDGAPTLTQDCETAAALEAEVARLGEELASALREGTAALSGAEPKPVADSAPPPRRDAPSRALDSDLLVADVMTREVHTIGRNDKIALADELMRAGRFRHVLVVEDDGSLAGVVSQRDIVFSALGWQLGQGSKAHRRALEAVAAKELMQTQVVTIEPGDPIQLAAQRMTEHKVGCLPVLEGTNLVGILTEGDFLSLVAARVERP